MFKSIHVLRPHPQVEIRRYAHPAPEQPVEKLDCVSCGRKASVALVDEIDFVDTYGCDFAFDLEWNWFCADCAQVNEKLPDLRECYRQEGV